MTSVNRAAVAGVLVLSGCDAFLLQPCTGLAPAWREVSTGYVHVCALDAEGEAACAPSEYVGDPPTGPLYGVTSGYDFSCALDADGRSTCWGDDVAMGGQIADAPTDDTSAFVLVEAGMDHVCGVQEDDAVACWGDDSAGQSTVPAELGRVQTLSAGYRHTCAIDEAGALRCWGAAGAWLAEGVGGTWALVAAGQDLTCAVDTDDALSCWGSSTPDLAPLEGVAFASLAAGALGLCALDADSVLTCALLDEAELPTGPVRSLDLSLADASLGSYGCVVDADDALSCFGSGVPNLPTATE